MFCGAPKRHLTLNLRFQAPTAAPNFTQIVAKLTLIVTMAAHNNTFEAAGAALPAPLTVASFLGAHGGNNSQFFSFSAAPTTSAGDCSNATAVSPLFEDAPVYRSVPMGAVAAVGGAEFDISAHVLPLKAAVAAAPSIVAPALPRPYVMSQQAWAVPSGKACAGDIVAALTDAFAALDMDAEFDSAAVEFTIAATVAFSAIRFNVKLFSAGPTTLVEFNLVQGPSMQYNAAYARVVAELPQSIGSFSAARQAATPSMPKALPKRCSFSPPSLRGGDDDVAVIKAGAAVPLVRMAASGSVPMQRDAASALAELSTVAANAPVLVEDGVLAQLATLVSTSNDWGVVHASVTAMGNILSVVLTGKNPVVDAAVAASLAVISGLVDEVRRHSHVSADASAQQALRRQCCRALASMALNAQLAGAVQKAGGLDALTVAQTRSDSREASHACLAVKRICAVVA